MKSQSIFPVIFLLGTLPFPHYTLTLHRCGYHTKKERGYISTPNFPKPYPVPIICQWVIEAPPNCRIAVYFTQFYLKSGFSASEFAHYMADIGVGVSKSDFGVISSRDEPTYLMSNQRILVLDLQVYSLDNVHLRVTEHLLETYGFNITYEVLQGNENVRLDGCIYHHCSFTGFCLASEDLKTYSCDCVEGYFGEECQYDDDCGPTATPEVCYNGGTCRYYIGSSVRTCECPSGFEGAKCEKQSQLKNVEVSDTFPVTLETDHKCEKMHYTSHPDYITIYPDDRKCPPKGKDLFIIKAKLNVTAFEFAISESGDLKQTLENMVLDQLYSMFTENINITEFLISGNSTVIEFLAERGSLEAGKSVQENLEHIENDQLSVRMPHMNIQVKPMIFIERMEISEKMPIVEGIPLLIACTVHGGMDTTVKWLKDRSPIVFPAVHGRLWNSTIPKNSYDSFTFLLGFDKTHVLDSGTFTCVATDETGADELTIPVAVKQIARPLLTPLSATVRTKDSLTITCVSQEVHRDKNVTYLWTRNDGPLFRSREQVEDLFPSGSRVILNKPTESANYTCAIHSVYGVKKETSLINVVSDRDYSSSTCHRETLFGINWKLTAVDSEDFHLCPANYTGYIFRKCLRAVNESAVWQEPDFSRCISAPFLKIKNEFESYTLGYRIHSLNTLLKKMLNALVEAMSSLHLSEAEPFVDILSDVDPSQYLREHPEENWEITLNITSMLLNSTAVSRKQSKQKMYSLIRNISLTYCRQYLLSNSSAEFVSPTLTVKVWKIRDLQELILFPGDLDSSWNFSNVQLELRTSNSSDYTGNSSISVVVIFYRRHTFAGVEELPSSYTTKPQVNDSVSIIMTEAMRESYEDNVPITALLTYKHIIHSKRKSESISCFKLPVRERNQGIQACEKVERTGEDIVCQCFSSGLLSVLLLEKEMRMVKENHLSIKYKVIPIFGAVISITFLLYTLSLLGCKNKFSSLFE